MGCEAACGMRVSIRVELLQGDTCSVGEGRGFRRGGGPGVSTVASSVFSPCPPSRLVPLGYRWGSLLGVLLGKEAR